MMHTQDKQVSTEIEDNEGENQKCKGLALTDSNKAPFNPIFPEGVKPKPPTKPAHISDIISP